MNWRNGILIIMVAILVSSVPVSAQNEGNRIEGVAKFLEKRANEDAVLILQQKIKKDHLFQCLFPNTYAVIASNNMDLFLQSGHEVWKQSVDADLNVIEERLILQTIDQKLVEKKLHAMNNEYAKALKDIRIRYQGRAYSLKEIANNPDSPKELLNTAHTISVPYGKASAKLKKVIHTLGDYDVTSSSECPKISTQVVLDLQSAVSDLRAQAQRLLKPDVTWAVPTTSTGSVAQNIVPSSATLNISDFTDIAAGLTQYQEKILNINSSTETVARMFQVFQLIDNSLNSDHPLLPQEDYDRISRYGLSLAILSDAKSPDQAMSVMEQLALPSTSFLAKRKGGANSLFLTAYFAGASGGEIARQSKGYGGLTVPVGLELSHGLAQNHIWGLLQKDSSISLMLAPVDFGYPVNQDINNYGGTAKWKDILAPGAYLSYGLKNYPVVFGVGYSYGPSLVGSDGIERSRCFAFIGLDMPLWSF